MRILGPSKPKLIPHKEKKDVSRNAAFQRLVSDLEEEENDG
jgi:hypothetical protein